MDSYWPVIATLVAVINLALLGLLWRRWRVDPESLRPNFEPVLGEVRRIENALREESRAQRDESGVAAGRLREEISSGLNSGLERLLKRQGEAQQSFNESAIQTRHETAKGLKEFQQTVRESLLDCTKTQGTQLGDFGKSLEKVNETLTQQLDKVRQTVEAKLQDLQGKNEQKLEEMRRTVDEKLEATLERRLGESFKLVSERLEQVHKGLGEMQAMASSVGDLKRVLTNVKIRGTWGEIQLGSLLEQVLTPDQYGTNVAPRPDSAERVEFALKLPGNNGDGPVWLPIDAKFPQEDYHRLVDAAEKADAEGVIEAGKALELRLRGQARDISEKYVAPPHTTNFAIMFLASEGLYAEALRRPGLADALQREFHIVLTGPTTLTAMLNALQMGFRTLAIQQRSSEVWKVLGAVKTEFGRFGDIIGRVKKKLDEASNQIEDTERRTRAITRKLRDVEALPADEAARLLPASALAEDEKDEIAETVTTNGQSELPV